MTREVLKCSTLVTKTLINGLAAEPLRLGGKQQATAACHSVYTEHRARGKKSHAKSPATTHLSVNTLYTCCSDNCQQAIADWWSLQTGDYSITGGPQSQEGAQQYCREVVISFLCSTKVVGAPEHLMVGMKQDKKKQVDWTDKYSETRHNYKKKTTIISSLNFH